MKSIRKFIETKLRLKINKVKSKVDRPWRIKYLGLSFYQAKWKIEIRVHPKTIEKFKWKQWKKIKAKHDNLVKLGIDKDNAWKFANTRKSYWRVSNSLILTKSLTYKTLERFRYTSLSSVYC